jgi:hypothetical protein
VLLLAEKAESQMFHHLSGGNPPGWRVDPLADGISLRAVPDADMAGPVLLLVAGRQMATREGLEVLALGTADTLPDGLPLPAAVAAAQAAGALPVIPWGFGKWWFYRGRLLRELLEATGREEVLLGDNGGRPSFAPRPKLFTLAESLGIPVLPGSDPLPMNRDWTRAGSYGFVLGRDLSGDRPGDDLLGLLRRLEASPPVLGRRIGPVRFMANQIALRTSRRVRQASGKARHG